MNHVASHSKQNEVLSLKGEKIRNDAEVEAPILGPLVKSQLTGKDLDAGKD